MFTDGPAAHRRYEIGVVNLILICMCICLNAFSPIYYVHISKPLDICMCGVMLFPGQRFMSALSTIILSPKTEVNDNNNCAFELYYCQFSVWKGIKDFF